MHFFIDTNIIIDFISLREPFGANAAKIFNFADMKNISLYTSSNAILTAHYVLRKIFSEEEVREAMDEILELLNILSTDKIVLKNALKSEHKDFEDAVQIFSAYQISNLDGIITRDKKDFKKSNIPVFSPDEVLIYITKKLNQ